MTSACVIFLEVKEIFAKEFDLIAFDEMFENSKLFEPPVLLACLKVDFKLF